MTPAVDRRWGVEHPPPATHHWVDGASRRPDAPTPRPVSPTANPSQPGGWLRSFPVRWRREYVKGRWDAPEYPLAEP
jgi:hypothetical protein